MDNGYRIISKEEYNEKWRTVHDRIFTDRFPPERLFKLSHWEIFLFPEGFGDNETLFHAITPLAKQCGDREFVMFGWEMLEYSVPAIAVPWNFLTLREATDREAPIGSLDLHVFGQSGEWGIYSSSSCDAMYVGGAPEFMNALAVALGGRTAIQKEFLEYVASWETVEGDVGRAMFGGLQIIAKSVGWERPEENRKQG